MKPNADFESAVLAYEKRTANRDRCNQDRADELSFVFALFHRLTGIDPDPGADGPEVAAGDLIAHMMHHAHLNGWDIDAAIRNGFDHFAAETA